MAAAAAHNMKLQCSTTPTKKNRTGFLEQATAPEPKQKQKKVALRTRASFPLLLLLHPRYCWIQIEPAFIHACLHAYSIPPYMMNTHHPPPFHIHTTNKSFNNPKKTSNKHL
jgi:hypothetical protein